MSHNALSISIRKLLGQPSFLLASGVLLVAAISLNAATEFMQLYFRKLPVPLAQDLDKLPAKLGHWVQVSSDQRVSAEVEHELATEKYIFRDYVDDRVFTPEQIKEFEGKSNPDRKVLALQLQQQIGKVAVISVGVTYYTGMVDTVAHIPDRCYIADGYEPKPGGYNILPWSAFEGRPGRDPHHDDVRYINFEDQVSSRQSMPKNVAYFFHANGQYTCDPIGVRLQLQELTQRYAYYSKIELMTVNDAKASEEAMNDLLTSALPEIEKCLPDWQKVIQAGKKK